MSWLYTVVFAGLAMSSSTDLPVEPDHVLVEDPAVAVSVQSDETEKFSQTYPFSPSGRVNVSNINGSITVEAWDRSEVRLEYTKVADIKERLSEVEIKIDARADYFSVEADYPNNNNWSGKGGANPWRNGGKLNVEFRLMVPRAAVLNEIDTVNGSATVSNFTNVTRVSAVNGSVHASNLRGTAKLSTVNGEVVADFDRLEPGSKISLDSVNGSVRLLVPSDSNATVRADSLNGNIVNDFGLPVRKGKYVGRDMYGRLGKGGAEIKMDSVNGGLTIGRKNDGKGLSPVVDLLPQKKSDDSDWDGDEHARFKSAKIDKDVAKAVKDSTKATSKALADTHMQLSRIQPEIAQLVTESSVAAAEAISKTAVALSSEKFKSAAKDIERQSVLQAKMSDAVFFPAIPRVDRKTETFTVKGVPLVTVNGRGCAVTIRGWDRSEVQYRVTQFTDPRNGAPIDLTKVHTDSSLSIKVSNPSYEARDGDFSNDARRVLIEVSVPFKSNLKIDANGEIRIEGVSGDVQLTASDEPVNVRDSDGKFRVSTSDGPVRVIGFRGEVEANTSDGSISLEGSFTRLGAHTTDGAVTLTLPEGASADLEASCNEVEGDGIALTKLSGNETRSKYRIGKGGSLFKVYTDGEIRVRGVSTLKDSQ